MVRMRSLKAKHIIQKSFCPSCADSNFGKVDLQSLPDDESKLYFLIAKRFILQFYPVQEFEQTKAVIECEDETFLARGKVITKMDGKQSKATAKLKLMMTTNSCRPYMKVML